MSRLARQECEHDRTRGAYPQHSSGLGKMPRRIRPFGRRRYNECLQKAAGTIRAVLNPRTRTLSDKGKPVARLGRKATGQGKP